MKYHSFSRRPACVVFAALFLFLPEAGLAHGVGVFAFVDGGQIRVECGFSGGGKVENGRIVASDLETGETVAEGVVDGQGHFRFRPSDEFLRTGHGLRIRLHAGEGHQGDWTLSGEELHALSPSVRNPRETDQAAPQPAALLSGIGAAEVEAVVARTLDEKLAPLKRTLAERLDDGPNVRDIVGGIGWIAGLLGLGAYLKYRRTRHD